MSETLGQMSARVSRRFSAMAQSLTHGTTPTEPDLAGNDERLGENDSADTEAVVEERRLSGSHEHLFHIDESLEEELEEHPERRASQIEYLAVVTDASRAAAAVSCAEHGSLDA